MSLLLIKKSDSIIEAVDLISSQSKCNIVIDCVTLLMVDLKFPRYC